MYEVDDRPLQECVNKTTGLLNPGKIYPVCLPRSKDSDYYSSKGILAGWRNPLPSYINEGSFSKSKDPIKYRRDNVLQRQVQLEQVECKDPAWMESNTYYPQGSRYFLTSIRYKF